jgi:hypothetical protein
MTLNNAGDEIVLIDATTVERNRFEYSAPRGDSPSTVAPPADQ